VDAFRYQENDLYCEDLPLKELVEEFGTPLYVYSRNQILQNFKMVAGPLAGLDHCVCYALKANANLSILKLLAQAGSGADVVSGGELQLALNAGFAPEKITFAGVGKRDDEIEFALSAGVFAISAESSQEIQAISRIAYRLGKTARVTLRINPDIDAQSHPYITTGLKQNKFGIPSDEALAVFRYAASLPSISTVGVHTHIGSQITRVEPFVEAATFLTGLIKTLREAGFPVTHMDLGGGFGVQYMNVLTREGLPLEPDSTLVPPLNQFIEAVLPALRESGCSIWIEPGRSIVANAGALLTKVLYTKENGAKKFIIVDAGMNDLLRPSLYHAYHQIVPLTMRTYEHERVDVVGPICETGDFLARERSMPKAKRDDYLAVLTAGAYGFSLSSNYNARLKPAEILVNGEKIRIVRQRQSIDDLLK
jgi:diaminopimelate decarboxylase